MRGVLLGIAVLALGLGSPGTAGLQAKDWFPAPVDVWEPAFRPDADRTRQEYVPLEAAREPWRISVFIPHLKDAYWLGVNYGLVAEARRLGINLSVHEAGGYEHLEVQREQLRAVRAEDVDGVILAAPAVSESWPRRKSYPSDATRCSVQNMATEPIA